MSALRPLRLAGLAALAVAVAALTAPQSSRADDKKPDDKKVEKKADDKKPADKKPDAPAEGKKVKTKIKLTVPSEDAELTIDGKATKPTGTVREFETPEVDAGRPYYYDFSVTWRPNNYTVLTRTLTVEFKGGDDLVADLTKADPKNPDKAVVRWVPTPDDIVDEMIKLAKVTKDDVAFEPGPGDGKVLIAAVKAGAKKAVGIELDPKKAAEARDNVKKNKLDDKITIREGDALKVEDYGDASVVFLYMGNEFNNLLRPHLEKQLKPGTRIVSHRFVLGDWKPDQTKTITGLDGDEYLIHIWTVKAKSGTDAKKPETPAKKPDEPKKADPAKKPDEPKKPEEKKADEKKKP